MDKEQAIECLQTAAEEARQDEAQARDAITRALFHGRAKAFDQALMIVASIDTDEQPEIPKEESKKDELPPADPAKDPERDCEPMVTTVNGESLPKISVEESRGMSRMWLSMEAADRIMSADVGTCRHAIESGEINAHDIGDPLMTYVRVEDLIPWAKTHGLTVKEDN